MNDLERILWNHRKPQVSLSSFRQNLRRDLLNSAIYQKSSGWDYRFGFFISTAVATMLAVILVIFVLDPALPDRLHYAFNKPDQHLLSDLGPGHNLSAVDQNDGLDNASKFLSHFLSDSEMDQEFVRHVANQVLDSSLPVDARPISGRELYAVQKYRLNNGQEVLMYTEIPKKPLLQTASY